MLLAVDIGNTSTKFGCYDGLDLLAKYSIPTTSAALTDQLSAYLADHLNFPITSIVVSSVVPDVDGILGDFLSNKYGIEPFFVRNDLDLGLMVLYEPIDDVGADRIVNSFAAMEKYGVPVVVCSFGTATTIDMVSKDRELLGGVIAPGIKMAAKALHEFTAKLPAVEITSPDDLLGRTTRSSILSGLIYSQAGLIESVLRRIRVERNEKPRVIATGGYAKLIAGHCEIIDTIDENLLLDGLAMIGKRAIT